jgi:hypothetical protein
VDVGLHDQTTVSLCFRFLFSLPFTLFLPFYFTTKKLGKTNPMFTIKVF